MVPNSMHRSRRARLDTGRTSTEHDRMAACWRATHAWRAWRHNKPVTGPTTTGSRETGSSRFRRGVVHLEDADALLVVGALGVAEDSRVDAEHRRVPADGRDGRAHLGDGPRETDGLGLVGAGRVDAVEVRVVGQGELESAVVVVERLAAILPS